MYLVSLIIMQGGTVVRDLRFKPGLNLILDKPTDQSIQSGNNVGKTTVLRLVDFCLGSEGDDIWQDPEFKNNINQDVYDYLHGIEPVSITLIVRRTGGGTYRLSRLFQSKHRTEPLVSHRGHGFQEHHGIPKCSKEVTVQFRPRETIAQAAGSQVYPVLSIVNEQNT